MNRNFEKLEGLFNQWIYAPGMEEAEYEFECEVCDDKMRVRTPDGGVLLIVDTGEELIYSFENSGDDPESTPYDKLEEIVEDLVSYYNETKPGCCSQKESENYVCKKRSN